MQTQGMDLASIERIAQQRGDTLPQRRDLLQKTESIVTKLFPGQKVGQSIGTLAGYGITAAKEKYGFAPKGATAAYDLSSPTPLQVAGDIARGAITVAGAKMPVASSILGKTAQFGSLGFVSGGASGIAEGKSFGESAGQAVRQGIIGGLAGLTFGVIEKGVSGIGRGVGKVGEKVQRSVIRPSADDIKDGFKIQTLQKYKLGGSLQDTLNKTDRQLDFLSKELNKKLESSNTSINLNRVLENTGRRISGDRLTGFGSNTRLSSALQRLQEEVQYTSGPNGLVSVPEAQIVKRAAGHYGAWQYGFQDPESKASERVYNIFYNELKKEIETASPEGVRGINQRMSELIPVMNAVIRRIPVAERNRGLSLTDVITLVGATVDPRALAITGINAAQKSGKVGAFLAKGTQAGQAVSSGIGKLEQVAQTLFPSTR